jgi:Bax protein
VNFRAGAWESPPDSREVKVQVMEQGTYLKLVRPLLAASRMTVLLFAAAFTLPGCTGRDVPAIEFEAVAEDRGTGSDVNVPAFGLEGDVEKKKRAFFDFLSPIVESENGKVMEQRRRLTRLYDDHRKGRAVAWADAKWLEWLLEEYEVTGNEGGNLWEILLRRVDMIPADLALIQAAKESGWGTSRFAREGNSLFGQRCNVEGCGLVPAEREPGETYEVAVFDTVDESVRSYIKNLNTYGAYRSFRRLRFRQRFEGSIPDGHTLAGQLPSYSERGVEYLHEIRAMIRANRLFLDS